MTEIRVAIIGAGAMGANHARAVSASSRASVSVVVDVDHERAAALTSEHGGTPSQDLEVAARCDAVIVASSTASHTAIALQLLEAGRPLLIEKPLAADLADVLEILEVSRISDVPIMCGFVERFNPAFMTARSLIDEPVVHTMSARHSPANPRATASVVTDLLIHDIDLAIRLSPGSALPEVLARSWSPGTGLTAEIADCVLQFPDGMVANLSASRWSQRKIREVRLATEHRLFEVDMLRGTLTVYRHVRQFGDATTYRAETIVDFPFVRHAGEPLALQFQHFVDLIDGTADADAERDSLRAPHEVAAAVEST